MKKGTARRSVPFLSKMLLNMSFDCLAKLSELITCSIRQASSAAVVGETPSFLTRRSEVNDVRK